MADGRSGHTVITERQATAAVVSKILQAIQIPKSLSAMHDRRLLFASEQLVSGSGHFE
jgi:hypothetical protein